MLPKVCIEDWGRSTSERALILGWWVGGSNAELIARAQELPSGTCRNQVKLLALTLKKGAETESFFFHLVAGYL